MCRTRPTCHPLSAWAGIVNTVVARIAITARVTRYLKLAPITEPQGRHPHPLLPAPRCRVHRDRLPCMAEAFAKLPAKSVILDGEWALIDPRGTAHFYKLMAQMRTSHPDEAQLMFMAFDLMHQDGVDLRGLPLSDAPPQAPGQLQQAGQWFPQPRRRTSQDRIQASVRLDRPLVPSMTGIADPLDVLGDYLRGPFCILLYRKGMAVRD
jgi:hypothetical protein